MSTLPGDDISPDAIDTHAAALFRAGAKVAARGEQVNAHWKKLGASYGAPETEDLVAKMGPVEKAAARFDHRTAKVTSALETFADEARAIKVRAEAIRARGNAFLNGVVAHGIDHEVFHQSPNDKADTVRKEHLEWYQDDAALAENKAIFDAIFVLANDLQAAEARCASAITTAVGAEPVTQPGTSVDWTKVPAGTPTPWGTELSRRSETDAEAQVRGFYERPIGMLNLLLAANGVSNKTLNFNDINNMTFDPTAFDFSLKLRGQTEQALVQSGVGLLVLSSPLLGPLTLANLKSKNWFGSFSRATSGTVVKGGAAYLDQWKTDPQAARGGLVFDALTMFVPGGPEVFLPAKAGARVAEDVAGAGLRGGGADVASEAARAGTKVETGAGRDGLSHVPGSGLEARSGLGHAGESAGKDVRVGSAGKKLTTAADDFTLEDGPEVSRATAPRTPPVHAPEPVKVPEPVRVPASNEHRAPRVHEQTDEPKVVEHERVPAKVGGTAEHRTPHQEASRATSLPERELVHSGAPERSLPAHRPAAGDGGRSGGGDQPSHAQRPATGGEASAGHDAPPGPTHDLVGDEAGSGGGEHLHDGGDSASTAHDHSGSSTTDPSGPFAEEGARRRPRNLLDMSAQDPWAREVYDELANDPSATDKLVNTLADVERPSGRSGYSQHEIDQVLHHVLKQEHDLEDFETGTVVSRPFDPSADMAAALLRIRDGRPKASDLILIEHELAESSYMSSTGARYPEAHAFANERFNWEQSLEGGN